MENKNGKNGKVQGTTAVVEEPKKNGTPAASKTAVNPEGNLQNTEHGTEAAGKTQTVEDTIRRVQTLTDLIDKRDVLYSHLGKVNALKFGEFEEKDFLILNGGNAGYPIKSTVLCKKIAALVKEEIQHHIKEVEAQINF